MEQKHSTAPVRRCRAAPTLGNVSSPPTSPSPLLFLIKLRPPPLSPSLLALLACADPALCHSPSVAQRAGGEGGVGRCSVAHPCVGSTGHPEHGAPMGAGLGEKPRVLPWGDARGPSWVAPHAVWDVLMAPGWVMRWRGGGEVGCLWPRGGCGVVAWGYGECLANVPIFGGQWGC